MKYIELKNIIRHVKKNIPCQECTYTFKEKDITIIGIIQDTVFLDITCPGCKSHTIVNVNLLQNGKGVSYKHKVGTKEPISKNEVLDMHNFLKTFKGDICTYLKKD